MSAQELLEQARKAGLDVAIDGERLRVRGSSQLADLALLLIEHKMEVLALLTPAPPLRGGATESGDGDETTQLPKQMGVSSPQQVDPGRPEANRPACGALHVQPQHRDHRGGKAYCPNCGRFMGYVRSGE